MNIFFRLFNKHPYGAANICLPCKKSQCRASVLCDLYVTNSIDLAICLLELVQQISKETLLCQNDFSETDKENLNVPQNALK